MTALLVGTFVVGYICIAMEHTLRIDKAATAIITGTLCWVWIVLGFPEPPIHLGAEYMRFQSETGETIRVFWDHRLLHHMEDIAGILLFLMGAMTIVEIVDAHEGFRVITDRITARKKVPLLWIVGIIAFFLSAVLDNLTTAIVMVSLLRKLIADQKTRWLFGGVIIIAANAGGAWSPIGDVTTTMLWIGRQITAAEIIPSLFLVSIIHLLVPLTILSFMVKGTIQPPSRDVSLAGESGSNAQRNFAFIIGVAGLLFVPVFKSITHLPPFMGIMFSLGIIWVATEIMHFKKLDDEKARFSAMHALRKIDMPSVLFFLGILLSVSALQDAGQLLHLASWMRDELQNVYAINVAIGLLSAVVDNVPLVAASMGMYPIATAGTTDPWLMHFVQDGTFWEFLAYCAGTGGSLLIIGSAAGVAVMGLEKIPFGWYVRHVSLWALSGYLAGALAYIAMHT